MNILFNAIAFQLGWFACVLGGANQLPWLGTLVAILIVYWHLNQAQRPGRELTLLAVVGALGALWDSLLVAAGWLEYPSGMLLSNTAPHWIVAMWVLFASTLNVSLRWLRGRWTLEPAFAFTALAIGWAVFVPLLISLSTRLDGMRAVPEPAGA